MTRASRQFSRADQDWFGVVSGDINPLHVDPVWAGRHFPGELVVHGVHAMLWGLDSWIKTRSDRSFGSVNATFVKPILVGDTVELAFTENSDAFRLVVRGETMALVRLESAGHAPRSLIAGEIVQRRGDPPRDFTPDQLPGLTGSVEAPDRGALAQAFPHVAARLGGQAVAGLAAASTLVGMACPGLNSVLSGLILSVINAGGSEPLAFQVRRFDPALSRLMVDVQGCGVAGSVSAFVNRPAPDEASDADLARLVSPGGFAGQAPLIIGASSGIGAITARLLAAGGGEPVLGWRNSRQGAEAVARRIDEAGGRCHLTPFDVMEPSDGVASLAAMGWSGEELYYCASPRIFRRRLEAFQKGDLDDFLRVYVDGFYETIRALLSIRSGAPLSVFYPSSIALDDQTPDLLEYRMAKSAGEQLCAALASRYKTLKILTCRLPRIETRQTSTFIKVHAEKPEQVMAPIVRQLQALSGGHTV